MILSCNLVTKTCSLMIVLVSGCAGPNVGDEGDCDGVLSCVSRGMGGLVRSSCVGLVGEVGGE